MKRLRFSRVIQAATPVPAILLALLTVLHAAAMDKPATLPLSVYCFDYAGDLKAVNVNTGKSGFSAVELSTANVVDAGKAQVEDGKITLYGPAADGAEQPVAATLKIDGIKKPLAVLVPAADGEKPAYRSHVVGGDVADFPMGSYRLVNLSPYPVRVTFGALAMEFGPDSDKLFNPKVAEGELMAVTVDYKVGDTWLAVSSSRWAYRKDRRTLVCIQQSPQTQRMILKSIPLRD